MSGHLRHLIGKWEGTGNGRPGHSKVHREYRLVLNDKFLHIQNRSVYDPQPKNPKGEIHEDWGMISFDKSRKQFVMRQFHVEGFVNQYVNTSTSADGKTIVFTSESIENIPAGFRARETYKIIGPDEFSEVFELAANWERILRFTVKAISNAQNDADNTVLQEWRNSAEYWEKHAQTIRTMFAPVTKALIEDADIVEGDTVLDVAGGPGEPSLTIAQVVGLTGSVTCTDAVAKMVQAAEREASHRGINNISFRQCSADALPFEDQQFDVAVSRLGVMFFPDPVAALREMLRVMKYDGAISLAVWGKSDSNPFSYAVTNIVSRYVESPPAEPNAPGAFRFAEPGALSQVLTAAGAKRVTERQLRFDIEAAITPREFWEMRSQTSGTLREKLEKLPNEISNRITKEVEDGLLEFFPNNQMKFPGQMLVVTGLK